ncbi:lipopolysaccharide transport periplasmic protein LptA [Marinicella gelatinilytica]|uniref:lipopolysaccharide transport periplasmic protein LptA n=1 Tax=Marinicella gelatinilytica TaxID=2996017 RepID=UPI0022608986|nr:lipopolysaccharide transport periplasmic protein LptA [Marinicella gelatinilytica]MCX7544599.1 lipopolysaccharide transport periplasmic protein LptA [Marinicella gelatinilytica]
MRNLNLTSHRKIVILGLLFLSFSVLSLESDRQQKITLEGDGCISKLNIGQTECPKGMVIKQGSLMISSDYGLITHKDNQIATVLMTGSPVRMEQQMDDGSQMYVQAKKIDFDYQAQKAFLNGDVRIENNIGISTGDAMEFNLETQEIKAIGDQSQRFHLEIDPNND